VTTVRWRRGAVELFVDVAVTEEREATALLKTAIDRLDAVYTSRPLPAS